MTGGDGFAIPPVLAVVVLLSGAALAIGSAARLQVAGVASAQASAEARAVADAGAVRAMFGLLAVDAGLHEGVPATLVLPGGAAEIVVQDQGGLLDLNEAEPETLAGMLEGLGLEASAARRLADAVADWRDEDGFVRLNGAEAEDYRRAGLGWAPRDGPFERVDEVQLVLGMTSELFAALAPLVTVHGHRPDIDLLLAPEPLLLAVRQGDAEGARTILAARPRRPAFSDSRTFSIVSVGRSERGAVFVREAVVRITRDPERPVQVFEWRQAARW